MMRRTTPNRKTKMKTIKKRQIIREKDYLRLTKDITDRYDIKFTPFTKSYFEKRATLFYMKNKKYLGDQYSHYDYPKEMIGKLTGMHVWDCKYMGWLIRYNDQGEMVIRAGIRHPESRLGLAIFKERTTSA